MDIPSCRLYITLLLLLILGNAFLALAEKAVVSSKKSNLENMLEAKESPPDNINLALTIIEKPMPVLSALQIGISLIGLVNGIITGVAIAPALIEIIRENIIDFPFIEPTITLTLIAAILYVTLVLGELIPKHIALIKPEKTLCNLAHILMKLEKMLHLPVVFLTASTAGILNFFDIDIKHARAVTEDEVLNLIEQGTEDGTFEKTEQNMVDNIFHLSDQNAYALMTPRTQMVWLDIEDTLEQNLQIIKDNPDTVFPVARDNLDEFIGMLYTKDLLQLALNNEPIDLSKCIHTPVFIPKSMHSFKVLEQFRDSGIHEAVVLDEFGGVVGVITMHDIINEVVGDAPLTDEQPTVDIIKRDDHTWLIDGLLPIDDFKEHFNINEMPDEERDHYHTMGGFITSYLNYIPTAAESFIWNGFRFEIVLMDRARIAKILVTKLPVEKADSNDNKADKTDIAS